jgi:hypothetical protein
MVGKAEVAQEAQVAPVDLVLGMHLRGLHNCHTTQVEVEGVVGDI